MVKTISSQQLLPAPDDIRYRPNITSHLLVLKIIETGKLLITGVQGVKGQVQMTKSYQGTSLSDY